MNRWDVLILTILRFLDVFYTFTNFSMCTVVTTYLEHPCGAAVFSGRAHVGVLNY